MATPTATLARIAALEAEVAELKDQLKLAVEMLNGGLKTAMTEALVPLAQRVNEAHSRIDAASTVFNKLRAATVAALRR